MDIFGALACAPCMLHSRECSCCLCCHQAQVDTDTFDNEVPLKRHKKHSQVDSAKGKDINNKPDVDRCQSDPVIMLKIEL